MELASYFPKRIFVRYRAKAQLQADAVASQTFRCLDEALIKEITATLFQSVYYQSLYNQCRSKREAAVITDQMIDDLVKTYKRIQQQQQDPMIQQLNSLL
jgi:hypothetical protein